jgi:hypothetical protein
VYQTQVKVFSFIKQLEPGKSCLCANGGLQAPKTMDHGLTEKIAGVFMIGGVHATARPVRRSPSATGGPGVLRSWKGYRHNNRTSHIMVNACVGEK